MLCSDSTQLQSSPESAQSPAPLQPHLGEQWEEFVKYASELQRQMARGTYIQHIYCCCCFLSWQERSIYLQKLGLRLSLNHPNQGKGM